MTLVELLVASSLLVVLLTLVMISTSMLQDISTNVNGQYQEYQQTLPALVPIEKLVRAEVEPAPTAWLWTNETTIPPPSSTLPTPGFASIGNYSLTFYANVGTAYNNVTSAGTTAGPAKVVAQEMTAAGTAVDPTMGTGTSCTSAAPCQLQVQMYLPVVNSGTSTCPGVGSGSACQWQTSSRMIADIRDVTNSPRANQPIFSYNLMDPDKGTAFNLPTAQIQNGTLLNLTAQGYPSNTQSVTACALPTTNYPTISIACPRDAIQSVAVDLLIGAPSTGTAGTVENQLTIYRYPKSSGATNYPFQYSSLVG